MASSVFPATLFSVRPRTIRILFVVWLTIWIPARVAPCSGTLRGPAHKGWSSLIGEQVAKLESKNFDTPDEVLEFPLGRGEVVDIGDGKVLRITLQPGWKWSEHVKPAQAPTSVKRPISST